jgi:hypothetical protein
MEYHADFGLVTFSRAVMVNLGAYTVRSTVIYYVCALALTVVPVIELNEYVGKIVILVGLSALGIGKVGLVVRMYGLKLLRLLGSCGNLRLFGMSVELYLGIIEVDIANVIGLRPNSELLELGDSLIACKYSALAYALFVNVELEGASAVLILKVFNGKSEPLACNRNLCDPALVLSKKAYITLLGALSSISLYGWLHVSRNSFHPYRQSPFILVFTLVKLVVRKEKTFSDGKRLGFPENDKRRERL